MSPIPSSLEPSIAATIAQFQDLSMSNSEWRHYHKDRPDGRLTGEEYQQYFEAVAKSEGFDVPHFAHAVVQGLIAPVRDLEVYGDWIARSGALAIKHYNEQNGTDFEMVEFVKVNTKVVQGIIFYMTFKAKPTGSLSTTTFQAQVYNGIGEIEVLICRKLEPSP